MTESIEPDGFPYSTVSQREQLYRYSFSNIDKYIVEINADREPFDRFIEAFICQLHRPIGTYLQFEARILLIAFNRQPPTISRHKALCGVEHIVQKVVDFDGAGRSLIDRTIGLKFHSEYSERLKNRPAFYPVDIEISIGLELEYEQCFIEGKEHIKQLIEREYGSNKQVNNS